MSGLVSKLAWTAPPLLAGLALGVTGTGSLRVARLRSDDPTGHEGIAAVESVVSRLSVPIALAASAAPALIGYARTGRPITPAAVAFGVGVLLGLRQGPDVAATLDRELRRDHYATNEDLAGRTLEELRAEFAEHGITVEPGYAVEFDPTFPAANGMYVRTTGRPSAAAGGRIFGHGHDSFVVGAPVEGAYSREILAHELGHRLAASVGSAAKSPVGWELQALGESLADTYAAGLDDDWIIGNDAGPGVGRSMGDPFDGEPVRAYRMHPRTDAHVNAGVPNYVAHLIGEEIGRTAMLELVHETVQQRGASVGSIAGWADALMAVARERFGGGSPEAAAVERAWQRAGYEVGRAGLEPATPNV